MTYSNGFSLFTEIEDMSLRTRNRAVILCNMFQDNSKDMKMTPKGAHLFLNYFKAIPDDEKQAVEGEFRRQMKERGYKE